MTRLFAAFGLFCAFLAPAFAQAGDAPHHPISIEAGKEMLSYGDIPRLLEKAREKHPEWKSLGEPTIAFSPALQAGHASTCANGVDTDNVGRAKTSMDLTMPNGKRVVMFACLGPQEGSQPAIIMSTSCFQAGNAKSIACQAVFAHEYLGHVTLGAPGCGRGGMTAGTCTKNEKKGEDIADQLAKAWVPAYKLATIH